MKRRLPLLGVMLAAGIGTAIMPGLTQAFLLGAQSVHAQPAPPRPAPTEDRVGFPEGYQSTYRVLFVYDRPDTKTVRIIYGNDKAAAANPKAGPNEVFPYGSILVMETYRAVVDEQGNPVLDANGRFQPGEQLPTIEVMRKEPGFGAAYQLQRSGEWEYVVYTPDRGYRVPPQNTNPCSQCHQDAGATKDWVFRANLFFYNLSGGLPQASPALAAAGKVVMQSYLFLPDTLTVEPGTTVTWANEDEVANTVTALDGSFDSGRMGPSTIFAYSFDQPGTYEYQCILHPASMKARVVVVEGLSTPFGSPPLSAADRLR